MKIAQNSEQNSSKTVFCKKNKQREILCLLHASPAHGLLLRAAQQAVDSDLAFRPTTLSKTPPSAHNPPDHAPAC
jgi:hypothetical protein